MIQSISILALALGLSTPAWASGTSPSSIAATGEAPIVRQFMRVSAAGGSPATTGNIRVGDDVPVSAQAFAPYAGSGAWRLDPGVALRCTVELPPGTRGAELQVQELGWLGSPADHSFDVLVSGASLPLVTSPARVLTTHTVEAKLNEGSQQILIANNREAGRVGIVSITVTYDLPLPQATLSVAESAPALSLVLHSPRAGQRFDRSTGIPIQWEADGFPDGTGVAIHWRSGEGPWTLIEDARNLPFNHPSGKGRQGHYLWQPPAALKNLEDLSFALAYEERARREPMQLAVGGEGGLSTIAEAMAIARDGDTITLAPGEYEGPVELPVSVTLQGEDMERTVILLDERVGIWVAEGLTIGLRELTLDCGPGKRRDRIPTAIEVRGTLQARDLFIRNASVGILVGRKASARFDRVKMEGVNVGAKVSEGRLALRKLVMTGGELGLRSSGAGAMLEIVESTITGVTVGVFSTSGGTLQMTGTTLTGTDAGAPMEEMSEHHGAMAANGGTLLVQDCTVADFDRAGLAVQGEGSTLRAFGGTVRGIAWNGVSVLSDAKAEIRKVTVEGCGRFGIAANRGRELILRDCIVRNNPRMAVQISMSPGADVGGNQSYGNGDNTVLVL